MSDDFLTHDRGTSAHDDEPEYVNAIDVFALLSIFFMVLSSQEKPAEKAPPLVVLASHLTEMQGQSLGAGQRPGAVISFGGDKRGQLHWNTEPISLEQLAPRLDVLKKTHPEAVIFLAGDKDASYGLSLKIRTILSHYAVKVKELSHQVKE